MGTLDSRISICPAGTCSSADALLPALLNPTLPETGPLKTIAQLMGAEEQLDNMEAEGQDGPEYLALRARVVEFVLAHPELREAPWLRCAGAVSDLLEALRVSRPEF